MTKQNCNDLKKITILVIEDDKINQEVCRNLLQLKGWDVCVVENGYKALEILKSNIFDVILIDIAMPGIDGYQTTSIIREIESKLERYTPIIAVTAAGSKEKCIQVGMDDYISKPINFDIFFRIIERFL